jgi:hypothetical protein
VLVTIRTLALQRDLAASSLNLSSGAHLQLTFTSSTVLTKGQSAVEAARRSRESSTWSSAGSHELTLASSPFTAVTTTGTIDISALSLGNASHRYTFGFPHDRRCLRHRRHAGADPARCGRVQLRHLRVEPDLAAHDRSERRTTVTSSWASIGLTGGGSPTVTSVTYGGVALTQLGTTANGTGSSRVALYGLLAPSRGPANVVGAVSSTSCNVVGGSLSYKGVNQSTPFGTAVTGSGAASPATLTVNTSQGDKVVSVLSSNAATSASPVQAARPFAERGAGHGAGRRGHAQRDGARKHDRVLDAHPVRI